MRYKIFVGARSARSTARNIWQCHERQQVCIICQHCAIDSTLRFNLPLCPELLKLERSISSNRRHWTQWLNCSKPAAIKQSKMTWTVDCAAEHFTLMILTVLHSRHSIIQKSASCPSTRAKALPSATCQYPHRSTRHLDLRLWLVKLAIFQRTDETK